MLDKQDIWWWWGGSVFVPLWPSLFITVIKYDCLITVLNDIAYNLKKLFSLCLQPDLNKAERFDYVSNRFLQLSYIHLLCLLLKTCDVVSGDGIP